MSTSETTECKLEEQSHVLCIKGIPDDCEKDQLKKLFGLYGFITNARIYRKPNNGFNIESTQTIAFISFDNIESADNAMRSLNRFKLRQSVLHISKAKKKIPVNNTSISCSTNAVLNGFTDEDCSEGLFVRGIPFDYSEQRLIDLFTTFGAIDYHLLNTYIKNSTKSNHGFVQYINCSDAYMALNSLNGKHINRYKLEITFSDPKHKKSDCDLMLKLNDKKSDATIHDLDDDLLKKIFDFFSIKQRFAIMRVCLKWKQICTQLMADEKVVTFGRSYYKYSYECIHKSHRTNNHNDISDAIIGQNKSYVFRNLEKLRPIIRLTYSLECLHFSNCFIDTIALKWIITQSPKLHCLRFDSIEGIGELDWPKFGKPLSSKIIHFSFGGNKLNHWKSLKRMVTFFDILQDITIFDCNQDLEKVFLNLSQTVVRLCVRECETFNLKAIKALNRSNGPKVRDLIVDFSKNNKCEHIIDSIYDTNTQMKSFKAFNINKSQINRFYHDIETKQLRIAFKDEIILSVIAENIRRDLKYIDINGYVKPSNFEFIAELVPECVELKIRSVGRKCEMQCECNPYELVFKDCSECFQKTLNFICNSPKLQYLDFNDKCFNKA